MVGRGVQPGHVRQTNQRTLLGVISLQPGISNAELARTTGLAPQTVTAVLADLEGSDLVFRGEVRRGLRGQPATPLYMNPVGALAIGAEIGWKHIDITLVGIGTQVMGRYRREYDYPDGASILPELANAVGDLIAPLAPEDRKRVVGMGLAAPLGIGSPASLLRPPNGQQHLWAGIDLAADTASAVGLDVVLINDGHAACWAERVSHPQPRPLSFVFLILDTFVGAGIFAENRLWTGDRGTASHLGSMLVTDETGQVRFVHELASLQALDTRLAPIGMSLEAIRQATIPDAAMPILDAWIDAASDALAQTLINVTRVMEFEVAIVESALPSSITTRIVETTRDRIGRYPTLGHCAPPLIAGHLGRSGAAEGAALLLMYRRFFSRELAHMDN